MEKIKSILGSVRFWLLTVAALGTGAEQALAGELSLESALGIVTTWAIAVATVGTVDRFGEKVGGK